MSDSGRSECRTKEIEQSLLWIDSKNPANIYAESKEVLNRYHGVTKDLRLFSRLALEILERAA